MRSLRTITFWQKITVLALCAGLTACSTSPSYSPRGEEASPHYKIGKPYKIKGKWYTPADNPNYKETGIASWYGKQFHGRLTANGEIFDMNRLSAAHKTLPLPSIVEVTNLENGRKATLRVNDRGPFADNRIIDLSKAAADKLGFQNAGLAKVRVRYVGRAPLNQVAAKPSTRRNRVARASTVETPPMPAPQISPVQDLPDEDVSDILTAMERAPALTPGAEEVIIAEAETADIMPAEPALVPATDISTGEETAMVPAISSPQSAVETLYVIRIAALTSLDNADALRDELSPIGNLRFSRVETDTGSIFYRINMGPYASLNTAAEKLTAVRAKGYDDASLVTLTP